MKYYADSYLRDEKDLDDIVPYCFKATVEDLTGLPPTLMITAEADPLRDGNAYKLKQTNIGIH